MLDFDPLMTRSPIGSRSLTEACNTALFRTATRCRKSALPERALIDTGAGPMLAAVAAAGLSSSRYSTKTKTPRMGQDQLQSESAGDDGGPQGMRYGKVIPLDRHVSPFSRLHPSCTISSPSVYQCTQKHTCIHAQLAIAGRFAISCGTAACPYHSLPALRTPFRASIHGKGAQQAD